MSAPKKTESPDFEKALERLELLVAEMETGKLSLDQMMAHFEEGSRLVNQCSGKLDEVEKKIEKLVTLQDAETTEPFSGS
ncbi:MAG TPA: exodeoxyribonuclease VII small subunit [Kiritimatiellia bacterium]|nr:exodeoxyribonuclease VII small subunit [Kiritimatiellia bacterium]HMP00329.1 exodeoxyribonuclease VII small subunit [Kiritimatiellia bacterium]HMP97558.1 exodeoxyribonuclease VII small subunit [Kiritimatiellia bacterium]